MKRLSLLFFSLLIVINFNAQTTVFAQLTGSPTMITTGWVLSGSAAIGDTPGDAILNFDPDEMILTPNEYNKYGHCFYEQPINIGTCKRWKVEFDYRMFSGGGADGIAFCFLDAIPVGYIGGGGMGIPVTANGLKVAIDPYPNGCGNKPEIQVLYDIGYNECNPNMIKLSNTGTTLNYLRRSTYNSVRIEYNDGEVKVYVNNVLLLTANVGPIPMTGYMGFSASTGMVDDQHSIRNVKIYADVVNSNAGPDAASCSGQGVQLGTAANANYTYNWIPSTGLSQTNVANPTLTLTNMTSAPVTYEYIVQTGLATGLSCLTNDTVRVTINAGPSATRSVNICQGQSYTIGNQTFSTAGAHVALVPANSGCDSLITVNLALIPAPNSVSNVSICQGGSYTFNGTSYSTAGTYSATFPSPAGCDSVAILNLTVAAPLTRTENVSICQGGSITYDGSTYTTAGTYPHTFQTAQGCDSIVTLNVTVTPPPTGTRSEGMCQNGSVTFGGTTFTAPGTYNVMLQNPTGCDSIVVLTVSVVPVLTSTQNSVICQGESVTLNGTNYNTTGVYNATFQTVSGCDSIVTLNLTVKPSPAVPKVKSNSPLSCIGDEFVVEVENVDLNGDYFWTGPNNFTSDLATFSLITTSEDIGTYSVFVTIDNCSSSVVNVPLIVVGTDLATFEMPNVITPNGDNVNDILDINQYFNSCAEYELIIWNRWGNIVYTQKQGSVQFQGLDQNGIKLTSGTYFYKLKFNKIEKAGSISLYY